MRFDVTIMILLRSICLLAVLGGAGIVPAVHAQVPPIRTTPVLDQDYRQSFEKWKAELEQARRQNWLTLVGLFWLKPGENMFGSDPGNAVVLPAGTAPATAGTFVLEGKDVTMRFRDGVAGKINGTAVTASHLDPDVSGHPTLVELGSLRMHVIRRGDRSGIRVQDLRNPAAEKYRGAIFYPLNAAYRISADWVPGDGKQTVMVPNVLGDVTSTPVVGEARFRIDGQEVRLSAVGGDAERGLFFIFSDTTRRTETYPAGRFLETEPVKGGKVMLDFNRAYNPPCSLTPYATCPLPPKEDQLAVSIPAGEKYDHSQKHPETALAGPNQR
jgi:uncharacterized protein (DUF1684 family)